MRSRPIKSMLIIARALSLGTMIVVGSGEEWNKKNAIKKDKTLTEGCLQTSIGTRGRVGGDVVRCSPRPLA
eukprot:3340946-Pyramimonas_sp.AAC.1